MSAPTCCLLRPDMADLTVPLGSIIMECCRTLGGSLAMLTPYGTKKVFDVFKLINGLKGIIV